MADNVFYYLTSPPPAALCVTLLCSWGELMAFPHYMMSSYLSPSKNAVLHILY